MSESVGDPLYRLLSYELFPHQLEGQLMVVFRLGVSDPYGIGTSPSQGVSEVHFLLDRTELDRLHSELGLTLLDFEDSF